IQKGQEWDISSGINVTNKELKAFINSVPFAKRITRENLIDTPPQIEVPTIDVPKGVQQSTQEAFGKIMNELGKGSSELSSRIVTTSPDVTVSTNLGGWVNQRSPFHVKKHDDIFRQMHLPSPQKWSQQPLGQHIELGIAENNLFLLLSALGLSHDLFKERLIPIGTLYDPFVARGLDALTYACYQDSRFIVVGTPSGISLGPEGGAHQSIFTPLIGIGHPNLRSFEPAYGDELAKILQWGFLHMQKEKGSPLYIRLSTRPIEQPKRKVNSDLSSAIISGAYWEVKPAIDGKLIIAYCGVVANEAKAAFKIIAEDMPGAGLLAITSPDQIYANWTESKQEYNSLDCKSTIGKLLSQVDKEASIVTIHDGHPLALSWLGSVRGQYCLPLGVDKFGQAGNIKDLYAEYGIDTQAIVEAIAQTVICKLKNT
ncbi:MAG: transketolase, partial [Rhodospirillaceae bacterium]|nr:transketolase [Rhodospirillaceae bacterium]